MDTRAGTIGASTKRITQTAARAETILSLFFARTRNISYTMLKRSSGNWKRFQMEIDNRNDK